MRQHFREGKTSKRGKRDDANSEFGSKARGAWRARFGELRVSVKHLELLAALKRGDGLSAAARRLNVSQSGASRAARRLERLLGITLLEEGDGHLMLTADGEDVAVSAVIVVEGLREFRRAVRRIRLATRMQAKAQRRSEEERGQKSLVANSSGTIDAAGRREGFETVGEGFETVGEGFETVGEGGSG